jgi:hypothetical protein
MVRVPLRHASIIVKHGDRFKEDVDTWGVGAGSW